MMEGRPYKFRILELVAEGGSCWNYDLVRQLQKEYRMPSDYYRDCLNFDIIEVAASGMICECDSRLDEEGSFKPNGLLIKYRMTQLGLDQLEDLRKKVNKRKGDKNG